MTQPKNPKGANWVWCTGKDVVEKELTAEEITSLGMCEFTQQEPAEHDCDAYL